MVAAVGASEGVDEDGGAILAEVVVVAVARVVAAADLGGVVALLVQLFQQVDIGLGLLGVGIDHHQSLVAAAEEVDIDQQLDFVHLDERHVGKIAAADEAALLAAEEEEDVGVAAALLVAHPGQVEDGGGTAGIVVGTEEDGVTVHAKVLIVSRKDNHRVRLTGNVSADILRAVAGLHNGRP